MKDEEAIGRNAFLSAAKRVSLNKSERATGDWVLRLNEMRDKKVIFCASFSLPLWPITDTGERSLLHVTHKCRQHISSTVTYLMFTGTGFWHWPRGLQHPPPPPPYLCYGIIIMISSSMSMSITSSRGLQHSLSSSFCPAPVLVWRKILFYFVTSSYQTVLYMCRYLACISCWLWTILKNFGCIVLPISLSSLSSSSLVVLILVVVVSSVLLLFLLWILFLFVVVIVEWWWWCWWYGENIDMYDENQDIKYREQTVYKLLLSILSSSSSSSSLSLLQYG